MVALRTQRTMGLLVMGSEDPQRFYPEMGTVYLMRLSELVSASLGHQGDDAEIRSQSV
jgi:uncharacterized protein YigA (DUF484 family)